MTSRLVTPNLTEAQNNYILSSPSLKYSYALGQLADNGVIPCANADEYIFWDELHPTHVVHEVLAQIVEQRLNQDNSFLAFR